MNSSSADSKFAVFISLYSEIKSFVERRLNGSPASVACSSPDKLKFKEMEKHLSNIDLTRVIEVSDETNLQDQAACAGGNCEIV